MAGLKFIIPIPIPILLLGLQGCKIDPVLERHVIITQPVASSGGVPFTIDLTELPNNWIKKYRADSASGKVSISIIGGHKFKVLILPDGDSKIK